MARRIWGYRDLLRPGLDNQDRERHLKPAARILRGLRLLHKGGWTRKRGDARKSVALLLAIGFFSVLLTAWPILQKAAQPNFANAAGQLDTSWYFLGLNRDNGRATAAITSLEDKTVGADISVYDKQGGYLATTNGSRIEPRDTETFDATNVPKGGETLLLRSRGHLLGSVRYDAIDGTKSEIIPAIEAPSRQLDFPRLLKEDYVSEDDAWEDNAWKQITLFNVEANAATLEAIAFDPAGIVLERNILPALPALTSRTYALDELFAADVAVQLSAVRVVSDNDLAGMQLLDPPAVDLVGLPALTTASQGWSFPIAAQGGDFELWTAVGVFNSGTTTALVSIEAFDAEKAPLGEIDSVTLLPGATHFIKSANLGGRIPWDSAFVSVTSDRPIGGYEVVGVVGGTGVTAVRGIPAEDQDTVGFELQGSVDATILVNKPLMALADGSIQPAPANVDSGFWTERAGLPSESVGVNRQSTAVRGAEIGARSTDQTIGGTQESFVSSSTIEQSAVAAVNGATVCDPSGSTIPTFSCPIPNPSANPAIRTQQYAKYNGIENGKYHAGIDMRPNLYRFNGDYITNAMYQVDVLSAGAGRVAKVFRIPADPLASPRWCEGTQPDPITRKRGSGCIDHGLGNTVIIEHDAQGVYTLYAHLDSISVEVDDEVTPGESIGKMGNSADGIRRNSCGTFCPHLHFEVKDRGVLGGGRTDGEGPWGYTPSNPLPSHQIPIVPNMPGHPNWFGYHDPNVFLNLAVQELAQPTAIEVLAAPLTVKDYPSTDSNLSLTITRIEQRGDGKVPALVAIRSVGSEWYQVHIPNDPPNENPTAEGWSASGWVAGSLGGTTFTRINTSLPQAEVVPEFARVRSQPSSTSSTLAFVYGGQLANLQRFVPFESVSGWHRIYLPEKSIQPDGWVNSSDIRLFNSSATSPDTPANPDPANGATLTNPPTVLDWANAANATSYDVYLDGNFANNVTTSQWTVNQNLVPGIHIWQIVAKNASDSTPGPLWTFTIPGPTVPTGVFASDGTFTNKVQVSWNSSSGAGSYKVYRATSASGSRSQIGTPTGTSFDDTSATPGQTFHYWVKACNSVGCSGYSASDTGYRAVASPGVLSVTPGTGLRSSGGQGGPFNPSSKSYTLTNTGGTEIWYSISWGTAWVSVSPDNGTLAPGQSATVTVSINGAANNLGPETYTDTVNVINTTNGQGNTTLAVSLAVSGTSPPPITTPAPGSTLTSTTVTFTGEHTSADQQHWLYVGTTSGGSDLFNGNMGTGHAATVSNLPNNGTIYVRYWTWFGATWKFMDQQYTMNVVTTALPPATTLVSPSGTITDTTPSYTWNAVATATWYYLWVNDSTGNRIKQWYTAAQAGCASGTGTCSVTPTTVLATGSGTWWVATYNSAGTGPWSAGMSFTLAGIGIPPAATLVSPNGTITDTTPSYTWNAVATATWYYLWVNDSTGNRIQQWYTAAQAGCASGTGTCSVTPTTVLAAGTGTWWIRTWNSAGTGPWSAGMTFTLS